MASVFTETEENVITANFAGFHTWTLLSADFKKDVLEDQLADFRIQKITQGGLF